MLKKLIPPLEQILCSPASGMIEFVASNQSIKVIVLKVS
jgi:hypothetical protein